MRGQITLFIIIGIILLGTVVASLYYYQLSVAPFTEKARPTIQVAAAEVSPFQEYVTSCLYTIGKDAINRVGVHGGYLDTKTLNYNYFDPTGANANAVQFMQGSDMVIPYWWYLKSANNCEKGGECSYSTKRIALSGAAPSIESQISDYVSKNLPDCIKAAKFPAWKIDDKAEGIVSTIITDTDVLIYLKKPVSIVIGSKSYEVSEYLTEFNVPLKRIYAVAKNLTDLEVQYNYLERATNNIIYTYANKDGLIPPVNDIDIGVKMKVWPMPQIESTLKQAFQSNLNFLQVFGSKNYDSVRAKDALGDNLYNRDFLVPLMQDNSDLDISYKYLDNWKPYIDLNCGGACKPESMGFNVVFLPFGITKYDFSYDVSYPVLVQIVDSQALKGDGYTFQFMLEQNLRNNQPIRTMESLEVPEILGSSLMCDNMNSENITVRVVDTLGNPINDASIDFQCVRETCYIGQTENGGLKSGFPVCVGGTIIASKELYSNAYAYLDTAGSSKVITLTVEQVRNVTLAIKKVPLTKTGTNQFMIDNMSVAQEQLPDEETTIILERQQGLYDDAFTTVAHIIGDKFSKTESLNNMPILSGNYSVTIIGVAKPVSEWIIPEREKCKKDECFTIPKMVFDKTKPFNTGQVKFNWELKSEDLARASKITFVTPAMYLSTIPNDNDLDDLSQMSKMQDYLIQYSDMFKPRIS